MISCSYIGRQRSGDLGVAFFLLRVEVYRPGDLSLPFSRERLGDTVVLLLSVLRGLETW